jgi:hypothetical protein
MIARYIGSSAIRVGSGASVGGELGVIAFVGDNVGLGKADG